VCIIDGCVDVRDETLARQPIIRQIEWYSEKMHLLLVSCLFLWFSATTASPASSGGTIHGRWSENYIESVLDARQCLNNSHVALLDRLFEKMNDMEMIKLYYSRGLSFFANRLQRGVSMCTALTETVSYIYQDIQWARQTEINMQFHENEKRLREEAARETMKQGGSMAQASLSAKQARASKNARRVRAQTRDPSREPTIDHIKQLLVDNVIRPACDRVEQTPEQLDTMKECLRANRKESIKVKINFKPTQS